MRTLFLLFAVWMLSACASTTPSVVAVPLPEPPPIDPGCQTCLAASCPALPLLEPAADGTASPDGLIALAGPDGEVQRSCQAALRECQQCVRRATRAGAIR